MSIQVRRELSKILIDLLQNQLHFSCTKLFLSYGNFEVEPSGETDKDSYHEVEDNGQVERGEKPLKL